MTRADRQYRSRIEILRDFLGAVRETGKKTRVIGLANLNPASYRPYLDFCLAHRLVELTPSGYRLTPHAGTVMDSIDRLVARSADLDAALLELGRGLDATIPSPPSAKPTLRYVSVVAFSEIGRSSARSFAATTESLESSRFRGILAGAAQNLSQGAMAPEFEPARAGDSRRPNPPPVTRDRRGRVGQR